MRRSGHSRNPGYCLETRLWSCHSSRQHTNSAHNIGIGSYFERSLLHFTALSSGVEAITRGDITSSVKSLSVSLPIRIPEFVNARSEICRFNYEGGDPLHPRVMPEFCSCTRSKRKRSITSGISSARRRGEGFIPKTTYKRRQKHVKIVTTYRIYRG